MFLLTSQLTLALPQIVVQYPKSVLMDQTFDIKFGLYKVFINSTNFQYITPGTKLVDVSGKIAYEGFGFILVS
ncbi:hypothetical protein DFR86_00915 [Acidianus sulfidivorans JP7]|nr:hypothetical protein [Acidianus sulfidivorans]AWR96243.2 hypothetical protein DFR86_00915 [Acidianus sulfidivorans JP7]